MKRVVCYGLFALVLAADTGTSVRSAASDYEAHQAIANATIAASLLSRAQAAKIFSGAVGKNFITVEIAVYPANGRTFDLSALDFALKNGHDDTLFAVAPEEVAWHGKRRPDASFPNGPLSGVHVVTEAGIGVGTRSNPATGQTSHGVTAYAGAEVDNRAQPNPPAQSNSADSTYVLEGKLRGLGLQEGQITRPISGYLYFAGSRKQRNTPRVLEYSRSGERALLTLPDK